MKANEINTVEDMENYIEGCLNDFDLGIATKEETIKYFQEYTERLFYLFKPPIINPLLGVERLL